MSAPNDTVAGALRDGFISRQLSPSLYFNPTGKPVAVKVARPVWSGGKVARPYLSLLASQYSLMHSDYDFCSNLSTDSATTSGKLACS